MRDLEVRTSMIWSARSPALIGSQREPLLPLQVFDVLSCDSSLLPYIWMKYINFSIHKSHDDPSNLDKKSHRAETVIVAANDSVPRPPFASSYLMEQLVFSLLIPCQGCQQSAKTSRSSYQNRCHSNCCCVTWRKSFAVFAVRGNSNIDLSVLSSGLVTRLVTRVWSPGDSMRHWNRDSAWNPVRAGPHINLQA
jgi:hypothetical protein